MISHLCASVHTLLLACKTTAIRHMHRLASGWDTQGVLPALRLPQNDRRKPQPPLHFGFSNRARKRLGWNHFLTRFGH